LAFGLEVEGVAEALRDSQLQLVEGLKMVASVILVIGAFLMIQQVKKEGLSCLVFHFGDPECYLSACLTACELKGYPWL